MITDWIRESPRAWLLVDASNEWVLNLPHASCFAVCCGLCSIRERDVYLLVKDSIQAEAASHKYAVFLFELPGVFVYLCGRARINRLT